MTARLAAEGVSVELGSRSVLQDVSLSVAPGEVLGVFGPSGAGKSTLFRALAGDERTKAGRVLLDGEDVSHLVLWQRARRGLGYLPQTPSILWDLTVAENLAVFVRLMEPKRGRASREAQEALAAELGLRERLAVQAGALSGGERRRLEMARALCAEPRVLLCDEPFSAIDPVGAARVAELLRALAGKGMAVLIADHHVAEALRLCDRALLLLEGQLALLASPSEFAANELVRKHYANA